MRIWPCRNRDVKRFLITVLVLSLQFEGEARQTHAKENVSLDGAEERLLAVHVNGQDLHEVGLFLISQDGTLLAREANLQRWRIRLPHRSLLSHAGEAYYPLEAEDGISYRIDESTQTVLIDSRPAAFQPTIINVLGEGASKAQSMPFGAFLNYDVSAQYAFRQTQLGALLEQGLFNRGGVGINTLLAQKAADRSPLVRLETTWTMDKEDWLASLRLGDAINQGGSWGRSVRFGGVQWSTNFAIRPDLITFPLPTLGGETALPSTVDLFVNNTLRLSRDIPPGPFSINNLPIITGAGNINLVVRDLLGREQVISQPYYASPRLLQKGLQEYSYEMGFIRENFGLSSLDYSRMLAVGTHRLGLSDQLTGEVHAEVLKDQQALGLGAAALWPAVGVWYSALAGSHSSQGAGSLLLLGFERQDRQLGLGGNLQLATSRFAQVGQQAATPAAKLRGQVFASLAMSSYGSLGLSYIQQENRSGSDVAILNTNYSLFLPRIGFLNFFFSLPVKKPADRTFGVIFTRALGERTSASIGTTLRRENNQTTLHLQRNLPPGEGFGYRAELNLSDQNQGIAEVKMQNNVGNYSLETSYAGGEFGMRGGAAGGVAFLDGQPYFTRTLSQSFGLVQVPGFGNVRVYADNHVVARTDENGNALLPSLRPYQRNPLRIEQADLPLDAEIDSLALDAVPAFRSGLLASFPVKRSRGALATILLDNGDPLPSGAVVQLVGREVEFPVGLQGEVYLSGLEKNNRLRVIWRGQQCEIDIPFNETAEPLPHLGTFKCQGLRSESNW
jgi:outer membrane usher protein